MFLQFPFLKQSGLCQVLTVLQSLSFSQIAVKLFLDPHVALFFLQNVFISGSNHLFRRLQPLIYLYSCWQIT